MKMREIFHAETVASLFLVSFIFGRSEISAFHEGPTILVPECRIFLEYL